MRAVSPWLPPFGLTPASPAQQTQNPGRFGDRIPILDQMQPGAGFQAGQGQEHQGLMLAPQLLAPLEQDPWSWSSPRCQQPCQCQCQASEVGEAPPGP